MKQELFLEAELEQLKEQGSTGKSLQRDRQRLQNTDDLRHVNPAFHPPAVTISPPPWAGPKVNLWHSVWGYNLIKKIFFKGQDLM